MGMEDYTKTKGNHATPLLMIIILLAIGKNENYIDNHYNRE